MPTHGPRQFEIFPIRVDHPGPLSARAYDEQETLQQGFTGRRFPGAGRATNPDMRVLQAGMPGIKQHRFPLSVMPSSAPPGMLSELLMNGKVVARELPSSVMVRESWSRHSGSADWSASPCA